MQPFLTAVYCVLHTTCLTSTILPTGALQVWGFQYRSLSCHEGYCSTTPVAAFQVWGLNKGVNSSYYEGYCSTTPVAALQVWGFQ